MADIKFYITAGLSVAKNSGQSPSSGENTFYIAAGLPPVVEAAGTGNIKTVSTVAWDNISNIMGISKASISKVAGVSAS